MKIIEHREDGALVQLTAELGDATFHITDQDGARSLTLKKDQSAKIMVSHGGKVSVRYSAGNTDSLVVSAVTVEAIKKAATNRFPDLKVGL